MKISTMTIFFVLAMHISVWAADLSAERQAQAKRAQLLVEAQQYASARIIYEALLNTHPQPWEQSILHYNVGIIDIEEKRWSQALREFDAVDFVRETPSWLRGRLETNRAIALIGRIQELLTYILPNSQQPNEVLDQLQQLITRTKSALMEAQIATCQNPDANACAVPQDLAAFQLVLKNLEAEVDTTFEAHRIANLPPIDLIGTLIASLKSDRRQITVLDDKLLGQFLAIRETERAPYWRALTTYKLLPPGVEHASLQANSLTAATAAIDTTIASLEHLFAELFPQKPALSQSIARLRLDYAELLGAELSYSAMQGLLETYSQLTSGTQADVSERLVQARTAHQYGMQTLRQDDPAIARIFFTIAALWADLAMQAIPTAQSESSSALLKRMIFLQESINLITSKAQMLTMVPSTFTDTLQRVLNQMQQMSLDFSRSFQALVIEEEKQRYSQGECQDSPWNQVLPEFFEGHAEIAIAAHELEETSPHWKLARESQQRAISHWRRAWNHLEPANESADTTPEQQQPMPPEMQTKQLPFPETIRLLQQMESEDRPERAAKTQKTGVLRPW